MSREAIAVFSLVAEHGLHVVVACGIRSSSSQALEYRLSSPDSQDLLLCGMWDLPGSGIEPVSPALTGRFFTTEPPGKP